MPTERTYDRILAYLKGLLSDRQRHDLEKEMMHDVFEEEAFEGLSQLSAAGFQTDMDKINNRLQNRINHHKKRDLGIFLRLAAGVLLLAGLTEILYIVFRAPSANLLTNEKTKIETPKSVAPSAPLMEVQSAPVESIQKAKPAELKKKEPIRGPEAIADEPEAAYVRIDTVSMSIDYLAQEEVVLQDNANKKMKSPESPSKNENVPGISIRGVQAMQGKAAGVQVSSRSDDESEESYNKSTIPELSKPIPPGGSLKAFKKWVNDRLDYTAYKDYPGKYKITVELSVHANGTINDIRVSKNAPDVMAGDLKKIISQSPLWTAALKDDNPVDTDVVIRFVITVE
jgi:hypothetical protein